MPERLLIPKEDLVHLTHGTVVNRHQNPVIGANMSQNDLNFALFSAVISGNLSLVKLYLEAGAIPDASLNLREVETGNTVIMTSLHAIGEAFANGISILLLLPIIAEFLEQPSDPYVELQGLNPSDPTAFVTPAGFALLNGAPVLSEAFELGHVYIYQVLAEQDPLHYTSVSLANEVAAAEAAEAALLDEDSASGYDPSFLSGNVNTGILL